MRRKTQFEIAGEREREKKVFFSSFLLPLLARGSAFTVLRQQLVAPYSRKADQFSLAGDFG